MAWNSRKPQVLNRVVLLPVADIHPNPHQPRRVFDPAALDQLARSIAANGLLQPVSVRDLKNGSYELISGERRLLAYQSLGQRQIPAIILDLPTQDSAVLALVENLHRADLSFLEEAQAIAGLMENLGLTQQQAARLLCRSQPSIANKLRLLRLPQTACDILLQAGLTERHARALLALNSEEEMTAAAKHIADRKMNVAQAEAYIQHLTEKPKPTLCRTFVVRDVRLLFNTISQAVEVIRQSGFAVEAEQLQDDEYISYLVRVPRSTALRSRSSA
jgi:ParB family chromosome partitioning protein